MKDYREAVKDILKRDYFSEDEGWQIKTGDKALNNGIVLKGITIKKEGEKVAVNFYTDAYQKDGYTAEATAEDIYREMQEHVQEKELMEQNPAIQQLTSFPDIKDKIRFKLVNRKANQQSFEYLPHIDVNDDLAVSFYVSIDNTSSVAINNAMVAMWQLDRENANEYIWNIAKENTQKDESVRFLPMMDALSGMMTQEEKELLGFNRKLEITDPFILTNQSGTYGASVLLYDDGKVLEDCMHEIEKQVGASCKGIYVLPSSIHEVLLVADSKKLEADKNILLQMVQEVNQMQVMPADRLSDNLFYYDSEAGFRQVTYSQIEITR